MSGSEFCKMGIYLLFSKWELKKKEKEIKSRKTIKDEKNITPMTYFSKINDISGGKYFFYFYVPT